MRRRNFITFLAGGMTTWPFAVCAQQKAITVIGVLGGGSPGAAAPFMAAFRQGLSQTGYVEPRNLAIESRWAEGIYDRLPAMAADLVSCKVDVIVTVGGTPPALAAKNATATIPIVFSSDDPVERGLVASLARPGGNLTGQSNFGPELTAKQLELLLELVPRVAVIALLVNPTNPYFDYITRDVREPARKGGVQLEILKAGTEDQIDDAFTSLARLDAGALVVPLDALFNSRRQQLVALASRHAVPAIYRSREFTEEGGLISYGTSPAGAWHDTAIIVGKILKGAKPADLPVQQPTKFELVINLKTAKALGLTVPQSILAHADEVIE
jgi:putative ABC transport system substrate-binding protein